MPILPRLSLTLAVAFACGLPLMLTAGITAPHSFSNGVVADADDVNANFSNVTDRLDILEGPVSSAIIRDDDTNPTVCMRLKLKPGVHQFVYAPVDCTTGAFVGLSQDGSNVWQLGVGGTQNSCLDYYNNYPTSQTVNGKYLIDADGIGVSFNPQVVYCDMLNGGRTRVAVVASNSQAHQNPAAVSPDSVAEGNAGKLSDDAINALMTSEFRMICGTGDCVKGPSCVFRSDSATSGAVCVGDTNPGARGINCHPDADNTYYGYAATNGCHNGVADTWNNSGELWVR